LLQSNLHRLEEVVMKSFLSDWREAFVISNSYGMGDPLARDPKDRENREWGGLPAIASRQARQAGITRP
jgi:hypothetical protein